VADAGRNGRESRSRPAGRRRGGQRTLHGAHPAADPHGVERGQPVRGPRHADLRQPPDARAGLQGPRHEIPADHHHPGPDADLHQRRQVFGQKPESRLPAQRPRGRMDTRHGGPAEPHGHDPHARQMRRQKAGARTDGARAPFAFGMGRRGRQPAPRADARRLRVEGVGRSAPRRRPAGPVSLRLRARLQTGAGRFPARRRPGAAAPEVHLRLLVEPLLAVFGQRVRRSGAETQVDGRAARRADHRHGLARDLGAAQEEPSQGRIRTAHRLDRLHLAKRALPLAREFPPMDRKRAAEGRAQPPSRLGHPALRGCLRRFHPGIRVDRKGQERAVPHRRPEVGRRLFQDRAEPDGA